MVLPFIYFKQTIGINEVDENNSTALHWASYMCSEEVVSYLLSHRDLRSLDERDLEGNTPLMMAVNYGNTRIVRKLLVKGSNRYLKNNANFTPLDVAKENEYKTISKMLNEEFTCWDHVKFYCNVKAEYKPKQRSCTIPLIFIITYLLNLAIFNLIIKFTETYSLIAEGILFGFMFLLYLSLLRGPRNLPERRDLQ
jgi:palmitoyltransferase